MSYLAYHFTVVPPQPGSEILIAEISDLGFEAFDNTESGFIAYVKEELAEDIDLAGFQYNDFSYTCEIEKIPLTNWNSEWEKNFEPVYVDDLLVIRAPFHDKPANIRQEVVITPKMSFGTGHHQTTRLMCREMFATDLNGKTLLDMGCGTGILAILAKKLGASQVVGIDIDEWSVENSIENCEVNHVSEITIKKGDVNLLSSENSFDVILANINKNILKADIPHYSGSLNAGGRLLLSGFFTTDAEELQAVAEKNNLRFVSMDNENEWAMMVFERAGDA